MHPVKNGRQWLAATAAGLLALNIGVNIANGKLGRDIQNAADDTGEFFSGVKDRVEDSIDVLIHGEDTCESPSGSTLETDQISTETETFYFSPNEVGESDPDVAIIDQILDKIESSMAHARGEITEISVNVQGKASDEWFGLGEKGAFGLGHDEDENEGLSEKRAVDAADLLRTLASERGIDLSDVNITVSNHQNTLDQETLTHLQSLVESHGLGSIAEALRILDRSPNSLPSGLRQQLDVYISQKRTTTLQLTTSRTTSSTEEVDRPVDRDNCNEIDGRPGNENHDYDLTLWPFIWPALPLFMRKRITKMKGTWIDGASMPPNPQRLLIHEDGVSDQDMLDKAAWAYVRKYMYLFREDDRISKVYEHSFSDEKGEKQSLKAIFVDHEPTAESVTMIGRIFQFAGQIDGGRLGRDCDVVVITPSKNAGLHGDAKRVGMGLEVQYEGNVLGVAIPSLGIVEMQMPEVPSSGELEEDYNSAAWTLAHELTGHFSQLNNQPNQLTYVGDNANGRPVYTLPNRFAYPSMEQYLSAQAETDESNRSNGRNLRWRTIRGLETLPNPGTSGIFVDLVGGIEDRALTESLHLKKQTGNPSLYGSAASHGDELGSSLEADAEAAANKVTGIPIPFDEAPEDSAHNIRSRDPQRFVDGYDVSTGWDEAIDRRWGSLTFGGEVTLFPMQDNARKNWEHRMGAPEDFEWARDLAKWARSVQIPDPNSPFWREIIVGQAFKKSNKTNQHAPHI